MFAVIDFETTNRVEDRRATEIAIAVLDKSFKVIGKYESVINPETRVYQESLGYSRLTQREIDSAPTFGQLWPAIAPMLSGNLLVMHKADFDRGVLANEFNAMGLDEELPPAICTLKNSQRILPGRAKPGGYKLENLAEYLGFPFSDAHQAMVDVDMTSHLFEYLFSIDEELRRTCEILQEDVVQYEVVGEAFDPAPRIRHIPGGKSSEELMGIAREIINNDKVQELGEVCRTGTLEDRDAFESALKGVHFSLQDAEPRKGTAFLVVGSKAGKRKMDKALSFNRPVLTEPEALSVIGFLKSMAN
ncbi:MAG: 3'-5' exonuclease [Micrococcales bacterium]|nr:3'-5' exonuclease [Micrococcales bacterium]